MAAQLLVIHDHAVVQLKNYLYFLYFTVVHVLPVVLHYHYHHLLLLFIFCIKDKLFIFSISSKYANIPHEKSGNNQ